MKERTDHQRGEAMIAQGVLGFQYKEEQRAAGMTALAGLPVYLDLFAAMGLGKSIRKHVRVRPTQGWPDTQVVSALVLLNLAGGDSVETEVWEYPIRVCRTSLGNEICIACVEEPAVNPKLTPCELGIDEPMDCRIQDEQCLSEYGARCRDQAP